ncbi:hypothetical protein P9112_002665 [Eukaryota sp. TZLM1-RC]
MPEKHYPRPKRDPQGGKLHHEKTMFGTKPKPLPSIYRYNPTLKPKLPENEVSSGLLTLLERGVINHDVNLTSTFHLRPRRVPLHPPQDQFRPQPIQENKFGFDFSNFKLDLSTPRPPSCVSEPDVITHNEPDEPPPGRPSTQSHFPVLPSNYSPPPLPPPNAPSSAHTATRIHSAATTAARSYDELMDATTDKVVIIRNGEVLETPEYQSLKRIAKDYWKSVVFLLDRVCLHSKRKHLATVFVDVTLLIRYSSQLRVAGVVNDWMILSLLNDKDSAKELAMVKIQSLARGFLQRKEFRLLKKRIWACCLIQQVYRKHLAIKSARSKYQEFLTLDNQKFKEMFGDFKNNFDSIISSKRVHLIPITNSCLSLVMGSLTDIRSSSSQKVSASIVLPFNLDEQTLTHWSFILSIGRSSCSHRARFISTWPFYSGGLTEHLPCSVASCLNGKTLKKIRDHTRFVTSSSTSSGLIIPSFPGPSLDHWRLASRLDLNVFGPLPSTIQIYGCRSGMRRIFSAAGVRLLPAVTDLIDSTEIVKGLIGLLEEFPVYYKFAIICDDLMGSQMIIDLSDDVMIDDFRRLLLAGEVYSDYDELFSYIDDNFGKFSQNFKPKCCLKREENTRFYSEMGLEDFFNLFDRTGGLVEVLPTEIISYPRVSLVINPQSTSIITTYDLIPSLCHTDYVAASSPSTSVLHAVLVGASLAIADAAREKGIIGFVDIQYYSIIENKVPVLYSNEVNFGHSDWLSCFKSFDCVTGGIFDPDSGNYHVAVGQNHLDLIGQRYFMFTKNLYHPNLTQVGDYVTFTKTLKEFSINTNTSKRVTINSFHIERRLGALFLPCGPLSRGFLTAGCVTVTADEAFAVLKSITEFIVNDLGSFKGLSFNRNNPNEFTFTDLKSSLADYEKQSRFVIRLDFADDNSDESD